MTAPAQEWQRLSPRMLLVHPVHEVLRQIPLLIGSVVLGSATDNPLWALGALGLTVGFGVARWFTTTYRIEPDEVQLRAGVLQRKVLSVPRNRIRTVSTDARLLHRLLGLTVLRVSTGQEARGDAEFALDAVQADQVPRLRAILLSDSLAADVEDARPTGRVLARWQPSWLRYSPLSFTGLAMIVAAVGLAYQAGAGAALENSRVAQSGLDAAQRFGVAASVAVGVAVLLAASVVLSVLRSLVTFGNLVLRRDAEVLHLEHGLLRLREHTFDMRRLRGGTLREPLLVRLFGGARLDAVMTGVDGAGEASLLLPPCPAQTARAVLSELIARPDAGDRAAARARPGGHPQALDAGADAAGDSRAGTGGGGDRRRGAGLGVAGLGGADRVLRAAGGRPVASAGPPGGRRLARRARRQPGAPPRLHRCRRDHRLDGAPDVLPAPRRGGDADRGHRGGCQGVPGDRRPGGVGVVGRRGGVAVGCRQRVGSLAAVRFALNRLPFTVGSMAVGGVLFDIDGVLVTSWKPIPGAAETLQVLADNQIARSYLTNTTTRTRVQIAELLTDAGMDVSADEVITAAVLTAEYVRSRYPDARCFLVNSGQIAEDMPGIDIVYSSEFDDGTVPDTPDVVLLGGAGPEYNHLTLSRSTTGWRRACRWSPCTAARRGTPPRVCASTPGCT